MAPCAVIFAIAQLSCNVFLALFIRLLFTIEQDCDVSQAANVTLDGLRGPSITYTKHLVALSYMY